jgi:hypothetical protein
MDTKGHEKFKGKFLWTKIFAARKLLTVVREFRNPMKRCSYCGAEYTDDVTVCAIDQTPFDKNYLPEGPTVAPVIKRKIPIRLSIVSYCFFASGVSYLGWFAIFVYLDRFLPLNLIIGILNLFVSRGLRRCSCPWRICALILIWLSVCKSCFKIIQDLRHPTHILSITFIIAWSLAWCSIFFILAWFYRVLTRPDIRELFYNES